MPSEAPPGISAVLIVRNEEKCIEACLHALRGVADEIVVVDTGSTDRSKEIASRFARVFEIPWGDDFAAARNAAIVHARYAWILSVDADEVIEDPDTAREHLCRFTDRAAPGTLGLIEIENLAGHDAHARVTRDHTPRFFRAAEFRFEGAIHEQLQPRAGEARAANTGVRLIHSGYAQAPDDPAHKARRNVPLLERAITAHPHDEYYHFQLGKAHFSLSAFAEAVTALEAALARIDFDAPAPQGAKGPIARVVLTDLLTSLAYAYVNTQRTAEARKLLEAHRERAHAGVERADFLHALGYVYLMAGTLDASREAYTASLAFARREDVIGTGSFRSHYHLGLLCEAAGDLPGAWAEYATALQQAPADPVSLARVIDLAAEQNAPVPGEVRAAADETAFELRYLEKIRDHLENGAMPLVNALVHGAAAISPALLQRCREVLTTFLETRGDAS